VLVLVLAACLLGAGCGTGDGTPSPDAGAPAGDAPATAPTLGERIRDMDWGNLVFAVVVGCLMLYASDRLGKSVEDKHAFATSDYRGRLRRKMRLSDVERDSGLEHHGGQALGGIGCIVVGVAVLLILVKAAYALGTWLF
jgi:hypothetical protein